MQEGAGSGTLKGRLQMRWESGRPYRLGPTLLKQLTPQVMLFLVDAIQSHHRSLCMLVPLG